MAVGDAAGAAGLATYTDSLLVNDIDTALNQRGDDIAAVMTRATTLEAQTIGVPKFAARRSVNGQNIPANVWTQLTANAWGPSLMLKGGVTFSGGQVTVPKAGIYDVRGHAMFRQDDYGTVALQITQNTTAVDTAATVLAEETSGVVPSSGSSLNLGVSNSGLVALNAGDVLRFFVLHRNRNGNTVNVGSKAFDLTFSVVWVDTL